MDDTKTSRGRVRPSVSGRATDTGPPAPRPRRSPWRIFVYAFVFACLVALSLVLRSTNGSGKTTDLPPESPNVQPSLPGITSSAPAAGGPIIDSDFAKASCSRPDVQQSGFTLIAAFETTAGTAAAWEDALSQGS